MARKPHSTTSLTRLVYGLQGGNSVTDTQRPVRGGPNPSDLLRSMPLICLVIGQRLGLPLHLVTFGIMHTILAGERDRQRLAALCDAQILKKQPARLLNALADTWQEAHLCVLRQGLEGWEFYQPAPGRGARSAPQRR